MSQGPQDTSSDHWIVIISQVTGVELQGPFTFQQLLTRLRDLDGRRVQVFPFKGTPYFISTGPFRFLLTPTRDKFPLFEEPCPTDINTGGHLYDPCTDDPPRDDDDPTQNGNLDDN